MTKTVMLHIGMHKAGSSAIQNALHRFDDGETFYATFAEENHSIPIYTAFSEQFRSYHIWTSLGLSNSEIEEKRAKYRLQLEEMLGRSDRQKILISGEDIGFLSASEKAAFADYIENRGWSLKVLCYVREPTEFAASEFQELVRHRVKTPLNLSNPSYRHRLDHFLDRPSKPEIIVRPFERAQLIGGDVVQDFCDAAGIDAPKAKEEPKNQSMSFDALRLLYNFNCTGIAQSGDRVLDRAYRKFSLRLTWIYEGGERIKPQYFREFADYTELDWLEKTFGVHFSAVPAPQREEKLMGKLEDISDIELAPIDAELDKLGARSDENAGPIEKMRSLYAAVLKREQKGWRAGLGQIRARFRR